MQPVFRFAPSPTGALHLGHAFSALTDFDRCREAGGRFLLRIEDTDPTRCRPQYEAAILDDLSWLGLSWEEPVRRQSEHLADYAAAIERLRAMGLVYPAFMSRGEVAAATAGAEWPRDPDGAPLYPPADRDRDPAEARALIDAGAPHALRLDMDKAADRAGHLSWQESGFAAEQTVAAAPTRLRRRAAGRARPAGLVPHRRRRRRRAPGRHPCGARTRPLPATSVHVLLQRLLDLPTPRYHHHRLITDAAGRKFSKSDRDMALATLRAAGRTPEDIRRMVGL